MKDAPQKHSDAYLVRLEANIESHNRSLRRVRARTDNRVRAYFRRKYGDTWREAMRRAREN